MSAQIPPTPSKTVWLTIASCKVREGMQNGRFFTARQYSGNSSPGIYRRWVAS